MKNIFLLILMSLPMYCLADLGTCFCAETEIETVDGDIIKANFKLDGYSLYIEEKNGEHVYFDSEKWSKLPLIHATLFKYELEYESKFSNYVLPLLSNYLQYYPDFIVLQYNVGREMQQVMMLGPTTVIPTKNIKTLYIKNLYSCGVIASFLTSMDLSDKSWATTPTKIEDLGGSTYCGYAAFQFQSSYNKRSDELLYEFRKEIVRFHESQLNRFNYSEEEKRTLAEKIPEQIRLLKEQKIIVMRQCSC